MCLLATLSALYPGHVFIFQIRSIGYLKGLFWIRFWIFSMTDINIYSKTKSFFRMWNRQKSKKNYNWRFSKGDPVLRRNHFFKGGVVFIWMPFLKGLTLVSSELPSCQSHSICRYFWEVFLVGRSVCLSLKLKLNFHFIVW